MFLLPVLQDSAMNLMIGLIVVLVVCIDFVPGDGSVPQMAVLRKRKEKEKS